MEKSKPDTPTSTRLAPEVKEALSRCAKKLDRSQSWVIETAVKQYLRDRGYLSKDDQAS